MILGIDASNIREGGGLTHLKEILENGNSETIKFDRVILWSNDKTLKAIKEFPWLQKETHTLLNKGMAGSFFFQIFFLTRLAKAKDCVTIFVPGGTFLGRFRPIVTMSQNMLPFEKTQSKQFENWKMRLRFRILFHTQSSSFKKSRAVIFLTRYAKEYISSRINLKSENTIIPHGISPRFWQLPKPQYETHQYSEGHPYKLLYVSIVTAYKHQWNVAQAVLNLKALGYPIELDLVGSATTESMPRLIKVLKNDVKGIINYRGLIPYEELAAVYKGADAFIFASSCENMPIILIEAMTTGLPIASSALGPMPEVLGEGGFYFDPYDINDIKRAIKQMLDSPQERVRKILKSQSISKNYTWKECSKTTFNYLYKIAKENYDEN